MSTTKEELMAQCKDRFYNCEMGIRPDLLLTYFSYALDTYAEAVREEEGKICDKRVKAEAIEHVRRKKVHGGAMFKKGYECCRDTPN